MKPYGWPRHVVNEGYRTPNWGHRWVPSMKRLEFKKARLRRHWKRKARAEGKEACKEI